jgi:hypothetical protein
MVTRAEHAPIFKKCTYGDTLHGPKSLLVADEDVLGLQIAVDDSVAVAVIDGSDDLAACQMRECKDKRAQCAVH